MGLLLDGFSGNNGVKCIGHIHADKQFRKKIVAQKAKPRPVNDVKSLSRIVAR